MKTVLIVLTLVELALLVAVLAGYLIAIAATLRRVSSTLGLVTFGVRAIDKQTAPIGPVVGDINAGLEQVADALAEVAGKPPPPGGEGAAAASPAARSSGGEATATGRLERSEPPGHADG